MTLINCVSKASSFIRSHAKKENSALIASAVVAASLAVISARKPKIIVNFK